MTQGPRVFITILGPGSYVEGEMLDIPCERCPKPAASVCCSSHNKSLCHLCYRQTHFVGKCVEGCKQCAAEGLPVLLVREGQEGTAMSKRQPTLHPICETLRDARLETGRSQTEVAAATGVWQSSISDYENGHSVPSVVSLDAWAAALGYVIVLVPMEDR